MATASIHEPDLMRQLVREKLRARMREAALELMAAATEMAHLTNTIAAEQMAAYRTPDGASRAPDSAPDYGTGGEHEADRNQRAGEAHPEPDAKAHSAPPAQGTPCAPERTAHRMNRDSARADRSARQGCQPPAAESVILQPLDADRRGGGLER